MDIDRGRSPCHSEIKVHIGKRKRNGKRKYILKEVKEIKKMEKRQTLKMKLMTRKRQK